MSRQNGTQQASVFRPPSVDPDHSSSPAFATPAHPVRPFRPADGPHNKASILPILLPPPTLRPLAFRTFTKKYSLTLTSSTLQVLASFIGKHCGTGWREDGLAERVLDEVARNWKSRNGGVIVDGESNDLKDILKTLEGCMIGGRVVANRDLSRHNSASGASNGDALTSMPWARPGLLAREDSLGMSKLGVDDADIDDDEGLGHPRKWLKVVDAFEQPRLSYNVGKKHFERITTKPSLLPPAAHKMQVFRNRYHLIQQRLLRNESFQLRTVETTRVLSSQQSYKLTPIANLLGRNGSSHMLLGLLTIAPTGTLAINDLTGSIALDLTHAKAIPEDGAWFAPGMIVLVDGTYEEDDASAAGGDGGVGGTIGGRFRGFFIGGAPCERRQITLGMSAANGEGNVIAGGGFGWVDFLGVGSERAVGSKMRRLEDRLIRRPEGSETGGRGRMVVVGEVNLDIPLTLQALKKILTIYAADPEGESPMTFVLLGSFVRYAIMARGGSGGSIEYKEYFDSLASLLSDFPTLLQTATFIFVPGDNDGWTSSFSAGAAVPIPRKGIPDLFTSRIKRAFATANAEAEKDQGKKTDGEAIWTSNPSRISLFGPAHEILLFRDNISARLRRTAVRFGMKAIEADDQADVEMSTPMASHSATKPQSSEGGLDPLSTSPSSNASLSHASVDRAEGQISLDLHIARKLVKTVLDQGYLSPFGLATRPILWDYASTLQIYPLPTAMVLADTEAPAFCVTYEGCHVMNPGGIVAPGRRGVARWVEYDLAEKAGMVREAPF